MKKIAIIGRGTAGAISAAYAAHYALKKYRKKIQLDWYYDSTVPTQAVGEGSTLALPTILKTLNFEYYQLPKIDGTIKVGISKRDWNHNSNYVHTFKPPCMAMHFNALKFQDYIQDQLEGQSFVKMIDKNVSSKEIDADLIVDCSGRPSNYDEFHISDYIAVNSVYVTQCYWDHPDFNYTISDAVKHGWVFGVPLMNRCSIGYLYNNKLTTLDEVKQDVQNVFKRYNLTPTDRTNAFSFESYYRKKNIVDNVVYNGNCSFFLEPLEATSTSMICRNAQAAMRCLDTNFNVDVVNSLNKDYTDKLEEITNMIMMHYFAGSVYKNDFWDFAESRAKECLTHYYKKHENFRKMIRVCYRFINHEMSKNPLFDVEELEYFKQDPYYTEIKQISTRPFLDYGTWYFYSYYQNIVGLGIHDKLKNHLNIDDFGDRSV